MKKTQTPSYFSAAGLNTQTAILRLVRSHGMKAQPVAGGFVVVNALEGGTYTIVTLLQAQQILGLV